MASTAFVLRCNQAEETLRRFRSGAERSLESHLSGQSLQSCFSEALRKELLKPLAALHYHEYRDLVTFMTLARQDRASVQEALQVRAEQADASPQYKRVLKSLNELHASLYARRNEHALANRDEPFDDRALDKTFAIDTVVLARLLYPLGICMNDPSLEQDRGIDASTKLAVWIYKSGHAPAEIMRDFYAHGRVEIRQAPGSGDCSELAFFPPHAPAPSSQCTLGEGAAVLIGRKLTISGLFGANLANRVALNVDLPAESVGTWSRAGLMVFRQHGKIYLFDRGARYPIAGGGLPGDTLFTYVPSVVEQPDHTQAFGQTQFFKLPKPDQG